MEYSIDTNNVLLEQQDQVESGEYNVTECNFTFSSEYDGLTKKAVFTGEDGTAYLQTIVDNKCSIPSEILEVSQVVEIGVYAYAVENEELILRYSPEPTNFFIHEGSYKEAQNSTPPTPSEIEQLQAQITENANDIDGIIGDIVDINSDIVDIKAEQITQNTSIHNNADNIETINEQISDINETITNLETNKANVTDLNALTERVSTNERDIDTIDGHISDINQNIDDLEQDLTNYSLITETGSQIELNINSSDFKLKAILKDKNGNVIYTSNIIDLPLETMVVGASYDNTTKEVVLTLQNGTTVRFSVADLVSGLVSTDELTQVLSNYYNKTEVNNLLANHYTKSETDTLLNAKANQTSLDTTNQNLTNLTGRISTNETDIANIKEEQTTQNTNIEELQNQVETLQEDLESANAEIEELNTDITNMRKAMITVDGQGSDITLQNTSENKFVEFELEGRTEQVQLTGKNLFDKYGNFNTGTGVNMSSLNENGQIVSRANFASSRSKGLTISNLLANTNYNLSGILISANGTSTPYNALIEILNMQNTTLKTQYFRQEFTKPYSFEFSFNTGENTEIWISFSGWGLVDGDLPTTIFDNIQIEEGSTATSYEPYCGGIPSPNPQFPQQIKNVTGNANVKIQNKNLAIPNDGSYNAYRCIEPIPVKTGDVLTYIVNFSSQYNDDMIPRIYADKEMTQLVKEYPSFARDGDRISVLNVTDNGYFTLAFGHGYIRVDFNKLFVAFGSYTLADYESHAEQNYPFTFAEGQRLMQGTTLEDDGIHNVRKQLTFTGNETWRLRSGTEHTFQVGLASIRGICTHYSINYSHQIGIKTGIYLLNTNVCIITDLRFNSVDDFKAYLEQEYLNGTPVIIEYETSTEEIIPYNATQQAQYNAKKEARSYDDITYITSTSDELGFNMNVVAVADANKVINSELQEIKSAVIALGGDLNV